ncbi:MAG: hypothetical protein R8J41_00400 [Alphaproteobacteria bacterium]|nr:hypothetical protein [Alphaproteobacteria bacterium]
MAAGHPLTLKQLHYRMVSLGLAHNSQHNYDRLVTVMTNARLRGLTDWDAIQDHTAVADALQQWSTPAEMLAHAARTFAVPKWAAQSLHVECWLSKPSVACTVAPICRAWGVPLTASRGYPSLSYSFRASQRFQTAMEAGYSVKVLHLADHSPTGLDETRGIRERLEQLTGEPVTVLRVGLNKSQIEQFELPPNPAKLSDSRAGRYAADHGSKTWELEALSPDALAGILASQIQALIDPTLWQATLSNENHARRLPSEVAEALKSNSGLNVPRACGAGGNNP